MKSASTDLDIHARFCIARMVMTTANKFHVCRKSCDTDMLIVHDSQFRVS